MIIPTGAEYEALDIAMTDDAWDRLVAGLNGDTPLPIPGPAATEWFRAYADRIIESVLDC